MSIDASGVLVDQDGRRRRASRILVPDLSPGDWVIVAAGAVIERLDPREAEEIVETLDAAVAAEYAAAGEAAAVTVRDAADADTTGGRS
jgi:hydrogenase maturation factor